ncbi:MAG: MopE-related protein [Myxococcota bacterium]
MTRLLFLTLLAACDPAEVVDPDNTDTEDPDTDAEENQGNTGATDKDGDGVYAEQDCDDDNADINPNAEEICDGVDNNCDEQIDEGFDEDADRFTTCGGDCDDTNVDINPDAVEICDELDNNCDEQIDEGAQITSWQDGDSDGFGDAAVSVSGCTVEPGFVENADDCDDASMVTFPGAAFEDSATDCMADVDGDGFGDQGPAAGVTPGTDCDDTSFLTYPGAAPLDSETDCMRDADGDDFADDAPGEGVTPGTDCDDGERDINPDAREQCSDDIDNDCDGREKRFTRNTFSFNTIDDSWSLNGDATQTTDLISGYISLTDAAASQSGSAFWEETVETVEFRATFSIEIGGGNGADGMAFLFLDETDATLVGDGGSKIGCHGMSGYAVEFDTYRSTTYSDPDDNHVAVIATDDFSVIDSDSSIEALSGSGAHDVEVEFNDGEIDVYFDGKNIISDTISGYAITELMFGFSAGTGALYDEHIVDDFVLETCQ